MVNEVSLAKFQTRYDSCSSKIYLSPCNRWFL